MKKVTYLALFALLFNGALHAQTKSDYSKTAKVITINKAFSCPVLTPRLVHQLEKIYNAKNIIVSEDKTFLTFSVPDTLRVNPDSIVKMADKVGFPPGYITVETGDASKNR